jgi:lipoprotein-anchoring transpeptidase ErfK/SrfK
MGSHVRRGGRCALPTGAAVAAALAAVGATVLVGMGPAPSVPPAPADAMPPVAALQNADPPLVSDPVPAPAEEIPPTTRRTPRTTAPPSTSSRPTTSPPSTARSSQRTATAVAAPRAAGAAILPAPEKVKGTPCTASARACVDLDRKKAWLIDGGRVTRGPVVVRHGDSETPTPRGTFRVQWKAEQYTSREYLTQMPYSVFFANGGIAFHEGTRDTPSAGCVKLAHEDAVAWFQFLKVGDEVQVH